MTDHIATEQAAGGDFRSRRYLGRYVPPPPPAPNATLTIAERYELLVQGVKHARYNAHIQRRLGNAEGAAHAFYRAHEYVEMLRRLRTFL